MPYTDLYGREHPDTCDPGPLARFQDLRQFTSWCNFCDSYTEVVNYVDEATATSFGGSYYFCESCYVDRDNRIERLLEAQRIEAQRQRERVERVRLDRQRVAEARRTEAIERMRKGEGRRFGIELEVEVEASSASIAAALERRGISCDAPGYTHEVMDCWKVVSDSSVECGWEIVSPPMTMERAKREVPIVTETLSNLGAVPADACGLHVHHEVADLSVPSFKRLVHRWATAEPLIDLMVAPHRREGQSDWCSRFDGRELASIDRMTCLSQIGEDIYIDRYKSLNISCFKSYGTVEVRQHHSTLDADEILAWVTFVQDLINDSIRARTFNRGRICATNATQLVENIVKDPAAKRKLTEKVLAGGGPTGVYSNYGETRGFDDDDYEEDCDCYECREARENW